MMRLVCPNCEAKYEVPEDAIPETGRDVQCANCGHAWYQMRPRAAGAEVAAVATPAPAPAPEPLVDAQVAEVPAPVEPPPADLEPVETAVTDAPPAEVEPEQEVELVADTVGEPLLELAEGDASVSAIEDAVSSGADSVAEVLAGDTMAAEDVAVDALASAEPTVDESGADEPVADEPVALESDDSLPAADNAEASAVAMPVAEAVAADAVVAAEETIVEADPPVSEEAAAEDAPAAAAYAVDESVLAILREEAEREAQARRAEAARPLETQTDLGIESAIPAAKKPVEVIGAETAEVDSDDKLANRRTRLPDVEEINSSLRPSEVSQDGSEDALPQVAEGRSSFRSGFLLVMTVAIIGSAVYASADAIADLVPALAGPLKAYVSFVDSLRLQLDGLMQSATLAINGG